MLWNDDYIPFSGVPFFVLGEKLLECHHGKDRNVGAKRKYQQKQVDVFSVFFFTFCIEGSMECFLFHKAKRRFSKRLFSQIHALHRMSH